MTVLSQIKTVVQQFAEAASAALRVDVEVVDDKLYRIAGTGMAKDMIGKRIQTQGVINRFIFKDTKKIIIDAPGQEENCLYCPSYGKCNYKKAVYASIIYDSKTIGAIGITAMSEEQTSLISYNNYAMLDFVDKIAELISTKVKEHEMLKQIKTYGQLMNTVINNIEIGIVILNQEFVAIDTNSYLENKLLLRKERVKGKHISQIFPAISLYKGKTKILNQEYQEMVFNINEKPIYLLCSLKPIVINKELEGTICLVKDYTDSKELAFIISEKQNKISFDDIVGKNIEFIKFKENVKKVAIHDSTVLLTGETGTGKEVFARAIHSESRRKNNSFVAINCGAIPETLIESELFGYEKGAFTGANNVGKHGKFYIADKGTLFLDEAETMPLYLQPKLLRVIERREIERVGGVKSIPIDVRIIAATNVRLDEMVAKGAFREDLFHRLNVVTLFIPPLRERGEDILVLADYFIQKFSARFNKNILGLSEEVKSIFLSYSWKGNVRELQNAIEYAINMEQSKYIEKQNLPFQFKEHENHKSFKEHRHHRNLITLEEMEKLHIKKALDMFGYSEEGRIEAAKHLGISRATIYRKIKKYQLLD